MPSNTEEDRRVWNWAHPSKLTADSVFARLQTFTARSPNWIVGDPVPEYGRLVERLRQRGVVGPLWSYFALLQRIQPGRTTVPA